MTDEECSTLLVGSEKTVLKSIKYEEGRDVSYVTIIIELTNGRKYKVHTASGRLWFSECTE